MNGSDVTSLDWAVKLHAAKTASTCIRSDVVVRTLIFHARVKVRPRRDGTHLRERNPKTQARVRSRVCPGSRRPSWRAGVLFKGSGASRRPSVSGRFADNARAPP